MLVLIIFMGLLLVALFYKNMFYKSSGTNLNMSSLFECGFNMSKVKFFIFSNRMFSIMIMFLIFDMELLLTLPLVYFNSMIEMKIILFILGVLMLFSLFWEYSYGLLIWLK